MIRMQCRLLPIVLLLLLLLVSVAVAQDSVPRWEHDDGFAAQIVSDFEVVKAAVQSVPNAVVRMVSFPVGSDNSGNAFLLDNPISLLSDKKNHEHFAIFPALGLGCPGRIRTSVTSAGHNCIAATNGGFFNVQTGDCIGYVISNGTLIQGSISKNMASFGLRMDGSFVIGYLTEKNVVDTAHPFSHLISGIGWLVRNGHVYVNQSMGTEGISAAFVKLKAQRNVLAHDSAGRLILIQVNGYEPTFKGVDLYEMAQIALKFGAVNAINLDGGGSSTAVYKGSLVSECTDACSPSHIQEHCWNSATACERAVTTIACIH